MNDLYKDCTKCGLTLHIEHFNMNRRSSDGRASVCRACRSAHRKTEKYRAQHAADQRKFHALNPERAAAKAAVRLALIAGKMKKGVCEVCGTSHDVEAHHDNYNKPLDVRWLCRLHHAELHRLIAEELRSNGGFSVQVSYENTLAVQRSIFASQFAERARL